MVVYVLDLTSCSSVFRDVHTFERNYVWYDKSAIYVWYLFYGIIWGYIYFIIIFRFCVWWGCIKIVSWPHG